MIHDAVVLNSFWWFFYVWVGGNTGTAVAFLPREEACVRRTSGYKEASRRNITHRLGSFCRGECLLFMDSWGRLFIKGKIRLEEEDAANPLPVAECGSFSEKWDSLFLLSCFGEAFYITNQPLGKSLESAHLEKFLEELWSMMNDWNWCMSGLLSYYQWPYGREEWHPAATCLTTLALFTESFVNWMCI